MKITLEIDTEHPVRTNVKVGNKKLGGVRSLNAYIDLETEKFYLHLAGLKLAKKGKRISSSVDGEFDMEIQGELFNGADLKFQSDLAQRQLVEVLQK